LAAGYATAWEEQRTRLDAFLARALANFENCPIALRVAMESSLLGRGKRLRPRLVLLAAEAGGGRADVALPAAGAVEMIHSYSLIHDDLPAMDDDDFRRGQPTCHKQFGEALAILAGDALQALAFQVLAEYYPPATAAACCRELAAAAGAAGMVGGQVEDLTWEGKIPGARAAATIADLERMHRGKTGALLLASLRMGLLTAQGDRPGGPDSSTRRCLEEFGRCFGLLFQITDDLLDAKGSASATGKPVGKDATRGKLTYPGFLGWQESRQRCGELAKQAEVAVEPLGDRGEALAALIGEIVDRDR